MSQGTGIVSSELDDLELKEDATSKSRKNKRKSNTLVEETVEEDYGELDDLEDEEEDIYYDKQKKYKDKMNPARQFIDAEVIVDDHEDDDEDMYSEDGLINRDDLITDEVEPLPPRLHHHHHHPHHLHALNVI